MTRPREALRMARARLHAAERGRDAVLQSDLWQATRLLRQWLEAHPRAARLLRRGALGLVALLDGTFRARLRRRRTRQSAADPALPETSPLLPFAPQAGGGRRILVIDQSVPMPDQHAGAQFTFTVLTLLREHGWAVAFWAFDRRAGGPYSEALERMGVHVADSRYRGDFRTWLADHGAGLDHIMLMRPRVADTLLPDILATSDAFLSYYGHDLHHRRMRMEAAMYQDPDLADAAEAMLAMERRVWRVVDVVTYPAEEETQIVTALEPGIVTRAIPLASYETFPSRTTPPTGARLLFVGGFVHQPNVDAVLWFARNVLPRVLARAPQAHLTIVGGNAPAEVRALAGPAVTIAGRVSDAELAQCYATHRVALAPLRFGAGVKGKVAEALQAAVPLVTTEVGAQGLPDLAGIVPVCDDAEGQAQAILRLLNNDAAWLAQSAAQGAYAERLFSRKAMRDALFGALGEEPA